MADNLTILALLSELQRQVNQVSKLQGPKGDDGPQGPQGIQGPKGEQGDVGPRGADGAIGPQGADGADGADGEDGVGVVSVSMAADGDLVFTLSDGTEHVVESLLGPSTASQGDVIIHNQQPPGSGLPTPASMSRAITSMLHAEEMAGLSSSFTHTHNAGRPVVVKFIDRAGCEVEVGVVHAADLSATTVTTVSPMDGFLYFY